GYFYFYGGEATEWLDRTVDARTINSLTLKEWIAEFVRLKALNQQIMKAAEARRNDDGRRICRSEASSTIVILAEARQPVSVTGRSFAALFLTEVESSKVQLSGLPQFTQTGRQDRRESLPALLDLPPPNDTD